MGVVDFDNVEPGLDRAFCSVGESLDDFLDPLDGQLVWFWETRSEWHGRRTPTVVRPATDIRARERGGVGPGGNCRRLAACMGELDANFLVLGMSEVDDWFPGSCVGVRPYPCVLG